MGEDGPGESSIDLYITNKEGCMPHHSTGLSGGRVVTVQSPKGG